MKDKYYANRGINRNKKPLRNIIYKVEISNLKEGTDIEKYSDYKFKDLGYLFLLWKYEGYSMWNWHGCITPDDLKDKIGVKQWAKLCQGKREFVIQRRIIGQNVSKV